MATPNLNQLSKDLSFKIFDPVSVGTDDGRRFTKELRLQYTNRAYGKMIRILEIIHPKIVKVFKNYYVSLSAGDLSKDENGNNVAAGSGSVYELGQPYDIYDAYYLPEEDPEVKHLRADWLDPDNFYPAKFGLNDHYIVSASDRKWTLINNKVMFLPSVGVNYYDVVLFCRNYFPYFRHNDGEDVFIPNDYWDLLITLAAIEAMSDTGNTTKYNLYVSTLNGQLQLIAANKKEIDQKGSK